MKCVSIVTCSLLILVSLVVSRDCPQCFHSLRLNDDNNDMITMETQSSNTRRIFRLKNSTNIDPNTRPFLILPLNRDIRKGIQSIHPFDPSLSSPEDILVTTLPSQHVITTTISDDSIQPFRIRPVNIRGMRRRRLRKRMRTSSTTTTTTTTTTAQPLDYYEYEDEYDYDDYHLTTTTTTTTVAPQRRRSGGRRRRLTTTPSTTTTTLSPNYKHRSDGRIIDYLADPNFPYELKGADLTDYPFFISIPENDFNCKGRHDGYYANIELRCQVYHHCAVGHQRYDFLCPNYTLFDQTTFTCRFINTVDCESSENYYIRNNELYVESTTMSTTSTTTQSNTNQTK